MMVIYQSAIQHIGARHQTHFFKDLKPALYFRDQTTANYPNRPSDVGSLIINSKDRHFKEKIFINTPSKTLLWDWGCSLVGRVLPSFQKPWI